MLDFLPPLFFLFTVVLSIYVVNFFTGADRSLMFCEAQSLFFLETTLLYHSHV